MIIPRLFDTHDHLGGFIRTLWADDIGARRINGKAHDHTVAVKGQGCIVDVEITVFGKFRMERDGIKTLFDKTGLHIATQRIYRRQVKERFLENIAVLVDDLDAPCPFGNENPPATVASIGDICRVQ